MGAERPSGLSHPETIEPSPARKKRNTDPGVGPPSGEGAVAAAHVPVSQDDDAPTPPDVVDFDALHAALGDLPPPPTSSSPTIGESQGRASATYSSSRPHTIPPTRAPQADELNAPAVIVQAEDTVPTGPPQQMTVPMAGAPPFGGPASSGAHPAAAIARPVTPSRPFTPEPFAASAVAQAQAQAHAPAPGQPPPAMASGPEKVRTLPLAPPRRPRTPTIVVRTRGPTKQQKLLVFMAMLLVFVGGGIAFLIYGKHLGIDIDLRPPPPPRATVTPAATPPRESVATTAGPTSFVPPATAPLTATVSATPSSLPPAAPAPSGKKAPRRVQPSPQQPPAPP